MLFFEIEHFTNKRSPLQTEGRRDCSPVRFEPKSDEASCFFDVASAIASVLRISTGFGS